MHSLRFPGIRAKIFVRKIDFKLRVMRLNHVESFNVFTARTRRRGWPWLATRGSRLHPRPPARGRLAMTTLPYRGGWPRPRPPTGAAGHGQPPLAGAAGCSQGPPARGLSATCKGRSPAGATARKGQWRARKGLPPAGPAAPTAGVAAPC
ncbi:hypothetical protein BHE74_00027737 [Ensete ventricosum]|nr:hypothetical protein GW17_00060536 [Ensete ventricosum]RWW64988.1 hypothetical protein BHE74_00027737 [Ensete ventricosum]